jgi:hypothetical protein
MGIFIAVIVVLALFGSEAAQDCLGCLIMGVLALVVLALIGGALH